MFVTFEAPQTAATVAPARTVGQLRQSLANLQRQQTSPAAVVLPSILPDSDGKQNVTASHNTLRRRHSAGPLLWDEQLARAAAAYARKEHVHHHSNKRSTRRPAGDGCGHVGSARYNFSSPGFSSDTGSFTQVVWRSSTPLGCAVQRCARGINGTSWEDGSLVACRYSPPGNIIGAFRSNVLPPTRRGALVQRHTP
ncbi:hypothetical protein OEZ85_002425 [Tetradesmus obliquus]|uniref:SCP domain-containing protein n=1 Tax=Tetradesmus obliquus TaxID=3088 RepID=A0ABY8U040_TETOB|nr:hypothetical protein OEZ85_002425 [Tetradesmus obliquus]